MSDESDPSGGDEGFSFPAGADGEESDGGRTGEPAGVGDEAHDHDHTGEDHEHSHDHTGEDHDHDHGGGAHEHSHDHAGDDHDGAVARLSVPDMDCASCAGKVENGVSAVDGVTHIDPRPTTGTLVVEYDPDRVGPDDVRAAVEGAGYAVDDDGGDVTQSLSVPGMDCPSCAGKVENALADVEGVRSVETQPTTGKVVVNRSGGDDDEVVRAVENAGYEVTDESVTEEESDDDPSIWRSRRALKTWVSGGFVALGLLFEFFLPGANAEVATVGSVGFALADVLFLVAVAVGGQEILRNGYYSLRNRNLDIDLLMSIAILGALGASVFFGEGLYMEAATLAFLFSIAELLERYSMDRARDSLAELMELSPDEATVRRDGEEVVVPVDELTVGDVVVVRPGEQIPADGEVVDGESAVNQAPVTGESVPVDKVAGDEVYAGTINEEGYLEVRVATEPGEDTLSRIVEMVEDAQGNKTEREQFVERFADYYTPVVVAFAVLTAAVPPLVFGMDATTWFVRGLTLIVLACPCAFVISTPVTVVSGITSGAKNGVLVKGGNHLEAMGEIGAVAVDKTGTLTKGELTVTDVVPLNGNTEDDVLRCAAGLEARSEHPIGEAIVDRAADEDLGRPEVSAFESITGKGVEATLDDTKHYAGKPGLFEELGFDLGHVHATTDGGVVTAKSRDLCERNDCLDLLEETVPELQSQGKTVVLVGTDDELEGLVAVADEVRPEAGRAVARLHDLGVSHVAMLTGDNERTAAAIAERVGVDEYRAELLPEEKVDAVRELDEEHGGVAMVGDGVNDAPALATATVGVAMGAAGTDTALETADVALMADDLSKLPYLYDLSNRATGVIRQNVWVSLAAKGLLALGVPLALVPIWAAVLVGDAGMTTAVTANAMRLSRVTPDGVADAAE